MVLTLSHHTSDRPRERSLVPACLQARAPLRYEILDEHDRRVPPTLAGYKLRRGTTYRMKVQTQEQAPHRWSVRLPAPRSLLEPVHPDEIEGEARVAMFHTSSTASSEPWNWFRSQVTTLPVHLDFEDGREPYRFSVPVILLPTRFRWIAYLLLTALLSVAGQAFFRDGLTLPSVSQVALIAVLWLLVMLVLIAWDQWKFYRQARRYLGETKKLLQN